MSWMSHDEAIGCLAILGCTVAGLAFFAGAMWMGNRIERAYDIPQPIPTFVLFFGTPVIGFVLYAALSLAFGGGK